MLESYFARMILTFIYHKIVDSGILMTNEIRNLQFFCKEKDLLGG